MKKLLISIVIIAGIVAGGRFFYQRTLTSDEEISFQLATVTRGDLENIVSSTGTLNAVGTVEVGSQISGTVEKVLVDYNKKVSKGQVLAVVDTTLLEATVRDAEAAVMQRKAQLNQAKVEHERKHSLFTEGYISEMEFLAVETNVETARANLASAEASLQRARTNLQHTKILSPIDGTVIERTIEAGQTIAASLNAPTLFTIAEDLSQMQIDALVDEGDIGQIKEQMPVRFSVQAYPDETFTGTVRQIRLKPTVTQDVVNYTVVVDASNERGLLLPGMTATVDFLVEERKDVLLVPNTALYFKPPEEILAQIWEKASKNMVEDQQGESSGQRSPNEKPPDTQRPDGQRPKRRRPEEQPSARQQTERRRPDGEQSGREPPRNMARVFYLKEDGTPGIAVFLPGVTNGVATEVKRSQDIEEGTQVITGINTQKESENSGFTLPFLGGGRRRRPAF